MKYMGSKSQMLSNGLGQILTESLKPNDRFVDLFSGSGAVSIFVATNCSAQVTAVDLQHYSKVLASSVLRRTHPFEFSRVWGSWLKSAFERYRQHEREYDSELTIAMGGEHDPVSFARSAREICEGSDSSFVAAYGGYYFSPKQSLIIESLRNSIPTTDPAIYEACLAALIGAASRAAAAPGHTAQPFSPGGAAAKHLLEAWSKDIWALTRNGLRALAPLHALCKGSAHVADANEWAKTLKEGDLAFIDPPYSGVHYSRFYHVLETLATDEIFAASGSGRYPPPESRPKSAYSIGTQSGTAFRELARELSGRGVTVIITYPEGKTSNGLHGSKLEGIATEYFKVEKKIIGGKFSTLGGNGTHREARQASSEMVLLCNPR